MANLDDPTRTEKVQLPPLTDGSGYGGVTAGWENEECLYGDLLLENRWQMTDGLYYNTETGESPADVF